MEESLSKESHTFQQDQYNASHSKKGSAYCSSSWSIYFGPYWKQVEPYWSTVHITALTYWHMAEQVAKALWQYPDVRLTVYILGGISALPLALFTLYTFATLFVATCAASIVGIFITAIGLTIGGLILAPFILGAIFLSIGVMAVYKLYEFWYPSSSSSTLLSTSDGADQGKK